MCQSLITGIGKPSHVVQLSVVCTKFHENTATPICSWTFFGCSPTTTGGLSSCNRNHIAYKVCYLALERNDLSPTPLLVKTVKTPVTNSQILVV